MPRRAGHAAKRERALCRDESALLQSSDYGQEGQIGLERTYPEFVTALAEVFDEVRRVLRPDGTVWLNLGDSYAGSWGAQSRERAGKHAPNISALSANQVKAAGIRESGTGAAARTPGLKPKDLIGIPWRVAFALQERGWWLRQRLPWVKRNPMPESTYDRPTTAVEEVFLFTKSGGTPLLWRHDDTRAWASSEPDPDYVWRNRETRQIVRTEQIGPEWQRLNLWCGYDYFYDYDAVKRVMAPSSMARLAQDVDAQAGSERANGGAKTNGTMKAVRGDKQRGHSRRHAGFNERWDTMEREEQRAERAFRNSDLFYASLDAPYGAIGNEAEIIALDVATQPFRESHFATFPPHLIDPLILAGCPRGGTVLDPFGGAGTTGLVADRLGRNAILIELNPEYAAMAERRLNNDAGLFAQVHA